MLGYHERSAKGTLWIDDIAHLWSSPARQNAPRNRRRIQGYGDVDLDVGELQVRARCRCFFNS
jgi:hypothetical protein